MTFVCRLLQVILLVSLIMSGNTLPVQAAGGGTNRIALIESIGDGHGPARYGLRKLEQALTAKEMPVMRAAEPAEEVSDFYIIAGLSSEKSLATTLLSALPQGKEALSVQRTSYRGKPAILLCGADEVGLMYVSLDVAKRISWSQD